jgi:oligopeptide/dipeptide ABC transporter ATP-binding protein
MAVSANGGALLDISGLRLAVPAGAGWRTVVDDVNLSVAPDERIGLVGESGSGKSLLALASLGLVPPPVSLQAGRVTLDGIDLAAASPAELRRLRGGVAGLVLQEPGAALNPVLSIGFQLVEAIRAHRALGRRAARAEAEHLLAVVRLLEVASLLGAYPHQLSGGQAQRVLLALALAGEPRLLLADEPTTALDVTTQAEVLALLRDLCESRRLALLLISHDLAVVASLVERVIVLLAGEVVESGPVTALLARPLHPFTRLIVDARPGAALPEESVRSAATKDAVGGCRFAPRCPLVRRECHAAHPPLAEAEAGHWVRCPVTLHGTEPWAGR